MDNNLNENPAEHNTASRGRLQRLVSIFARFLRRQFQCRFDVHWTRIVDICEEHDCPDCGKHFPAVVWPRCPGTKPIGPPNREFKDIPFVGLEETKDSIQR